MIKRFGWGAATALGYALACSTPAAARTVVIDGNTLVQFTPCTYGGASCSGFSTLSAPDSVNATPASGSTAISFAMNYGDGLQSNIYVYSNGLIAIGSPLSGAVTTINSLADLGQDVVAPAYSSSLQTVPDQFYYSEGISNAAPYMGQQFLRINFIATNQDDGNKTQLQANFYQTGNPGDFTLLLGYANSGSTPDLPDNALLGYDLSGNLNQTTAGQSAAALADENSNAFTYQFVNGALVGSTPAVPEPVTWLEMIAGFGLVGGVLRRRSWSTALA